MGATTVGTAAGRFREVAAAAVGRAVGGAAGGAIGTGVGVIFLIGGIVVTEGVTEGMVRWKMVSTGNVGSTSKGGSGGSGGSSSRLSTDGITSKGPGESSLPSPSTSVPSSVADCCCFG